MPSYFFRPFSYVATCLMLLLFSNSTHVIAQTPDELTLQVTTSATQINVGETVAVTGVVLKNGASSGLGQPQYTLTVETAPGVPQNANQPIFTPAQPAPNANGTFTLTAARTGNVTFSMSVNGEIAGTTDNGDPVFSRTTVSGRSGAIAVPAISEPPVQIPEPLTITLFATGLASLAGYTRRKRK